MQLGAFVWSEATFVAVGGLARSARRMGHRAGDREDPHRRLRPSSGTPVRSLDVSSRWSRPRSRCRLPPAAVPWSELRSSPRSRRSGIYESLRPRFGPAARHDREPRVVRGGDPRDAERAADDARRHPVSDAGARLAHRGGHRVAWFGGERLRGHHVSGPGAGRARRRSSRVRPGQQLERRAGHRPAHLPRDPNDPRRCRAAAHHPGLEHAASLRRATSTATR